MRAIKAQRRRAKHQSSIFGRIARLLEPLAFRRLRFESLEDRRLLATITVNDTADTLDNPTNVTVSTLGTSVSLRDAINAANNTGGTNTIVLASGATYDFATVDNNWYGPNALPPIASTIIIQGNGSTLDRTLTGTDTADALRFFYVSGGLELDSGSLELDNLTLENGLAKGGDSFQGGGGLGAGGAIFNQGALTLDAVTLNGNTALGGSFSTLVGNGGGGMGEDSPGNDGGGFGGAFTSGNGGAAASGGSTYGGGGGGFTTDASAADAGGLSGLGGAGNGNTAGGDGGSGAEGGSGAVGGDFGFGGGSNDFGGGGGVGGGGGAGLGGGGGGFGGGGGLGSSEEGGNGGFGAGGGGNGGSTGSNGVGGFGGGAARIGGGGGAGMGGAIFSMLGSVTIVNSTLAFNTAQGGDSQFFGEVGQGGSGYGGAIFNLDGSLSLTYDTIADNSAVAGQGDLGNGAADGGGIYNLAYGNDYSTGDAVTSSVTLVNLILAGSVDGSDFDINDLVSQEIDGANGSNTGNTSSVAGTGPNVVVTWNNGGASANGTSTFSDTAAFVSGATDTSVALSGTLTLNSGFPSTLVLLSGSDALDAATSLGGVTTDELNSSRPAYPDLGAWQHPIVASQLILSASPASLTAGQSTSLTITAEDSVGNVASTFTDTVTLADSSTGATFGSVSFSSGAATASATLDTAGSQTITATDTTTGTVTAGTSSAISVSPAAAAKLHVSASSTGLTAGQSTNVTITGEDAYGNVVTGFSANIALSGSLGGATFGSISFSSGVATTTATLNTAGSQTITATDTDTGTVTAGTSAAITVAPGAATRLVITTQPPASTTAGNAITMTVTAEDAEGNVTTGYSGTETAVLSTVQGPATLGGTLSATINSGVAAFSNLIPETAGSGYYLSVTDGTLPVVTSSAISVSPGAATQLVFTTEPPATVVAGAALGFTIAAEDAFGNVDTSYTQNVTAALAYSPGSGTLGGTLSAAVASGMATFSNLLLDTSGSGYLLAVTDGRLPVATTSAISVSPGTATHLVITSQPPATTSAGTAFGLAVAAEDDFGNVDPTFTGSVTASLAANPESATLGGTLSASAAAGSATLAGLTLNTGGDGYTIQLASGTLTAAVSNAIDVSSMLIISGASNADNDLLITFPSSVQFSIAAGGTTTSYSMSGLSQFVYNAPTDGSYSKLVIDDPTGTFTAVVSFRSITVNDGSFHFEIDGVQNFYLYGGPDSSATVNVSDGGTTSSNFFVDDEVNHYSYIADPNTKTYDELSGFGWVEANGDIGTTYAYVYSASHARTNLSPTETSLTVGSLVGALSSFPQVYVVGATDGSDIVNVDASGGTFVSSPGFSYATTTEGGENYLFGAIDAATVEAQAGLSSDNAVFYSYPGNTFSGSSGSSSLSGMATNRAGVSNTFVSKALGFNTVSVFESGSGTDTVHLTSPGSGSFFSNDVASVLSFESSTITVNTYFSSGGQILPVGAQLIVTGVGDGSDQADIVDAPGSNALSAGDSTATLTTAYGSLTIDDFGTVTANQQNGSYDTLSGAAVDFALQTVGNWIGV